MKAEYGIFIEATPERCFDTYVNEIDDWWPRRGRYFNYTWAPDGTEPAYIRFEPRLDGRYWETFGDGSEFEIGRITVFDRPHRLVYTWRGPSWPAATEIEVTFAPEGSGTRLHVTHTGWERLGDASEPQRSGYERGYEEVIGRFVEHVTS